MLVSWYLIIVLVQPGIDGGGQFHVEIENVDSEGHTEEDHAYDGEYFKYS